MAALAALALCAGVSLVLLAAFFHRAAAELAAAVESVRLAEAVQVDLLSHSQLRASPMGSADVARRRLEVDLRHRTAQMHEFAASPAESALVDAMQSRVEEYLAASRAAGDEGPVPRASDAALGAAVDAVEEVVTLNVDQAHAVRARAAAWDRRATQGGVAAALVLLAGVAAVLVWLRRALRPILELTDAMRRFGAGDRSARARETGPTELQAAARTFNDMAATLERERDARLALLGGVAHDLRNPLAALRLTAAVTADHLPLPPEPQTRDMFRRIDRQVAKLDRMIGDLLDAARVEAGRLSLERQSCDVRGLVTEVVDHHRPGAPSHQIEVLLPAQPVPVDCDPVRMEQVLDNLVGNAIKYSPNGGRVRVGVTAENGQVMLWVADQGLGISPEDQPHIFEPFRRGTRHDGIPGMGLGLSVARRIVEAHGGVLDVQSAPGAGAVFRVRLPVPA
jgi:signal transduction histidine kinase